MRLINWNIQRHGPRTRKAVSLVSDIEVLNPDLVILTEAHEGSLDRFGGHTLSHRGYHHDRKRDSERLVLMWSRAPWQEVTLSPDLQHNGGALLGRTHVGGRSVHCLALCIPYHMSWNVPRQAGKIQPWAQHRKFLTLLQAEMPRILQHSPLIIAGDFNQRMPRTRWGAKAPNAHLREVFSETAFVTEGPLAPLDLQTIDHVALSGPLTARSVTALSQFDVNGTERSDHFGVLADLDWV